MSASISIERVSQAIQQAAIDPDGWVDAQEQCERFMGAYCSRLVRVDHANGNDVWCRTSRFADLDPYFAEISRVSEPVRYAARNPHWRRFADRDYITPDEMARSEFYAACRRYGMGWRLSLRLVDEPGVSKAITFFWQPEHGHAERDEFDRLAAIEPQLRLAAYVANSIPGGLPPHAAMLDALERADCAALILAAGGALLGANRRAEAILRTADGLTVQQGTLVVARPAQAEVDRLLAAAARIQGNPAHKVPGGTAAVPRRSGLPPYLLTVAPLPGARGLFRAPQPTVLVLIRDPAASDMPDFGPLVGVFGLTRAEAEVCRRFAVGETPSAIADARGVREGSLRQQLKSAMAKLGVTRQAELMRLLRALPSGGDIPDGR